MADTYVAISSVGAELRVSTNGGSSNYKVLRGCSAVPDLFGDPSEIDVTDITSSRTRTIPGIQESSALAFEFFLDNSNEDSSYRVLRGIEQSGQAATFQLELGDKGTTGMGTTFEWQATVFTKPMGFASGDAVRFTANLYVTSDEVTIIDPS